MNVVKNNSLTQHVKEPTRDTILDLVLSSDPVLMDNIQVMVPLGSRDHNTGSLFWQQH